MRLLDEALRLEEEAKRIETEALAQATALREAAARLRAAAPPAGSPLSAAGSTGSIGSVNMPTPHSTAAVRSAISRATRAHPGQRILYSKGVTIKQLAERLGEKRARVSAWFGDERFSRPIPRCYAERLRDEYGIPINVWYRIAD